MISDLNDSGVDVIYDDDNDAAIDEELDISINRITLIARTYEDKLLQKSLMMNLARCECQLRRYGWAIRLISLSIALIDILKQSSELDIKAYVDAYYIRCKAFLSANRPKLAMQVFILQLKDFH
jgi:hypothetical protein